MRFFNAFAHLVLASSLLASSVSAQKNNGKTDLVEWDRSSLYIKGERVYIFSGEFHYPRLPVPELWLDIFQKLRATGFNAVSIYFFWAYHSPNPDTLDFTTAALDIQRLFDYAKEAGIWIITRSGPYINAETSAGGVALWTTTGAWGEHRTDDEKYHQAWLPFITEVGKIFAKNSIVEGGMAILNQHENEYVETYHDPNWTGVKYMVQIDEAFQNAGVVVPSTHNEKGMRGQSWSTDYLDVGGSVDIYGLDSYPNGFNCANPTGGFNIVKTYYQWFTNYSPTQPSYVPEYQGGAFDPWGGYGFENCAQLTGNEFSDVFYKTLVAQKISLISLYMTYGGTNWGSVAAPVVYTSYDYGAPLTESRIIRDKMRQIKLLTLFLRVSTDLRETNQLGNGTTFSNNTAIYTVHNRNPTTNAGFYWVNQNTSNSRAVVNFGLNVETSAGNLVIPNIQLDGRESKIIVTDYSFGKYKLLYSSTEVLTYAIIDDSPVLILYANAGQQVEFVLKDIIATPKVFGEAAITTETYLTKHTRVSYIQARGSSFIQFPNGPLIQIVDRITGWNIWAPALTSDPNVHADEHLLVSGPYLVRSAALEGSVVELRGDLNSTSTIEVFAPKNIKSFKWNGRTPSGIKRTSYGSLVGTTAGPETLSYNLPDLKNLKWKFSDSIPERLVSYNDSKWAHANHTTTDNAQKPKTLPVLYPDDYGFHAGIKLYRGYFNGKTASSVTLTAIGGSAFGYSTWLNGEFIGSWAGSPANASATLTLSFANKTLLDTGNVVFVVLDYQGHDQDSVGPDGPRNPRGISEASLTGGNTTFTEWRLIGNAGGESPVDMVRGVYNEGGLRAERLGWALPGFDDGKWKQKSPLEGVVGAGIEFYRTTFRLSVPTNYDVPLAVVLGAPKTTISRVQIYINGYQYGKYISHIGPQTEFPIPPGIINNGGWNTIGIAVWAQDAAGAVLETLELKEVDRFTSSFKFDFDGKYLQPEWTKDRLNFA